jgi:hypothetical protein
MIKICTCCNRELPEDNFPRRGRLDNSRRHKCKECINATVRAKRTQSRLVKPVFVPKTPKTKRESIYDRPTYVPPKWGR